MDQGEITSLSSMKVVKCSKCGCSGANNYQGDTWIRSVKRKYEEIEEKPKFRVAGLDMSQIAHVGIENECTALREMVSNQQAIIHEMSLELDEERNASASAANEAMSMILRLQKEKAELQMEARQFKRFSEEKMAHDVEEISGLEDTLYKRDQAIQSLTCEVHAYKHRMMSFGLTESEAESLLGDDSDHNQSFDEIDKHPFVETPRGKDHLKNGDISRAKSVPETKFSKTNLFNRGREICANYSIDSPRMTDFKNMDGVNQIQTKFSNALDVEDDLNDRVYTLDSVHHGVPYNNNKESKASRTFEEYVRSPTTLVHPTHLGDTDAKRLYLRLHELEADRESLRQTIISMQNNKAQLVLLKEITQKLSRGLPTERKVHVKKKSSIGSFSVTKVFKWCLSLLLWRKKARLSKFMFGLSPNNVGLLGILDKGPRTGHWRCLTSTQV